jgi:hypothetical protein
VEIMAKKITSSIDVTDEDQLFAEIARLEDLRWSLMVDKKVSKANKISDQLFELERRIPGLPDKGLRLLMQLAASPKEELRLIAANHLIPLNPSLAKKLLKDLDKNASNVFIRIIADTTLSEWKKGRIDYYGTMELTPDGKLKEG